MKYDRFYKVIHDLDYRWERVIWKNMFKIYGFYVFNIDVLFVFFKYVIVLYIYYIISTGKPTLN